MSTENNEPLEENTDVVEKENTEDDVNFFDLPDEEVMGMPLPHEDEGIEDKQQSPNGDDENSDDTQAQEEEGESEEDVDESDSDEEPDSTEDSEDDVFDNEGAESEKDTDENTDDDDEKDSDSENGEDDSEESTDDTDPKYKEAYEKIFAPFKAAGKEIKIDSPEEAIRLMQMGVDYNYKMQSIKPSLRFLRTLKSEGLLEDDKINYLIDLHNKDPKAIMKLVKESKLDPLEMNLDESDDYKANQHSLSEADAEIEEIQEELQKTPQFEQTVNIVKNELDQSTRQKIYAQPGLLRVINDHVGNGVYGKIMAEVTKQRALGHLGGLDDLQAYEQVGAQLYPINANQQDQGNPAGNGNDSNNESPNKNKQVNKKEVQRKKKAAKSVNKKPRPAPKPKYKEPFDMSDEEFEKEFGSQLR